jgi:hypothetical protein
VKAQHQKTTTGQAAFNDRQEPLDVEEGGS